MGGVGGDAPRTGRLGEHAGCWPAVFGAGVGGALGGRRGRKLRRGGQRVLCPVALEGRVVQGPCYGV